MVYVQWKNIKRSKKWNGREIIMPRPKKDGKMLNIKIQSEIYNTLEKYCDDKGQTKTIAIERILKEKFEKEGYSNIITKEGDWLLLVD